MKVLILLVCLFVLLFVSNVSAAPSRSKPGKVVKVLVQKSSTSCDCPSGRRGDRCRKNCEKPIVKRVIKYSRSARKDHIWGKNGNEFRCAVICTRGRKQFALVVKTPLKIINKNFVGALRDTTRKYCKSRRSMDCRCTKIIDAMQRELQINLSSVRRLTEKACPRGHRYTVLDVENSIE